MKVLIIHQNERILQILNLFFKSKEYDVEFFQNYSDALEKFYNEKKIDLIITDSFFKNISGSIFCEKIRNKDKRVGLFIISTLYDEEIKLKMLSQEIDDYLLDTFNPLEIELRITNLLKRIKISQEIEKSKYTFYDFELNLLLRKLKRNDEEIKLSPIEFSLLEILLKNKNFPLSREYLNQKVFLLDRNNSMKVSNKLEVYIRKLRTKIDDKNGKILQSVRGYGYIIKD